MMTIMFQDLARILAEQNGLGEHFWRENPIYISFGGVRNVAETVPYCAAEGDLTVAIDLSADEDILGIEIF